SSPSRKYGHSCYQKVGRLSRRYARLRTNLRRTGTPGPQRGPSRARGLHPAQELRLLGLELGVGDDAPVAQRRERRDLVGDARLLLDMAPGDPQAVVLHLGVDHLLRKVRVWDSGKRVLPPLAGGFDHEVARAHEALEEGLVVGEVVDP